MSQKLVHDDFKIFLRMRLWASMRIVTQAHRFVQSGNISNLALAYSLDHLHTSFSLTLVLDLLERGQIYSMPSENPFDDEYQTVDPPPYKE